MCLQWLHNFKASPLMTRSGSFGKQDAEGASGESQASWVPKGQGETPGHRLFVETLRQKDREKLTACRICVSHFAFPFPFVAPTPLATRVKTRNARVPPRPFRGSLEVAKRNGYRGGTVEDFFSAFNNVLNAIDGFIWGVP